MKLEKVVAVRNAKTIYRDGDKAIKVFNPEYSKADILNEALNHARVEETGLSVPKVLEVSKIDGKWAIITQFIEGKTFAKIMEEEPQKHDELLSQFIDIQRQVHEKRAPLLRKLKDKMTSKISEADLDATTRYDLHTRLDSMANRLKVCHGDFNPSNIIIAKDGTPYILDWSHVTQGNASADVARTYLLFWLAGDEKTADEYLDLYCTKTRSSKSYIQKWLPIVAASQSVKGKPEERELLLHWVSVVDYE